MRRNESIKKETKKEETKERKIKKEGDREISKGKGRKKKKD